MGELVKALRQFLVRDVVFILGGSEVILAFLYLFDRVPSDLPLPAVLLGAGFAYVLGYVVQDTASLLRLVRTQLRSKPNWLQRLAFWLFERRKLPHKSGDSRSRPDAQTELDDLLDRKRSVVRAHCSERVYAAIERTSALKQVGTTMGPATLVAGVLVAIRAIPTQDSFDVTLAIVLGVLGLLLVLFGWLKVTQQIRQIELHFTLLPEETQRLVNDDRSHSLPSLPEGSDLTSASS